MPQYLRDEAVRLIEASMEALNLALISLAIPVRRDSRASASRYASAMGLIGTAAENAMAAILVQASSAKIIQSNGTQFKTAREILAELRDVLRNPSAPRAGFLTSGISDPVAHRMKLFDCISGFSTTLTERACGLHAGSGPLRESAVVAAGRVLNFLETLKLSSRMRPYLSDLPRLPTPVLEPQILVDDLVSKFNTADGLGERATILRSLFLVIPEPPEIQPDWLAAVNRVSLAPAEEDLTLLVRTLESVVPVQLHKVSGQGGGIPVAMRPLHPGALPIEVHHLSRSLTAVEDQFYADVGTANGRLDKGILDLPPTDFVAKLFALEEEEWTVFRKDSFSAHEIWPFVASSLLQLGTTGPYWFLLKRVNDFGQLRSRMEKVFELKTSFLDRKQEFFEGLQAYRSTQHLDRNSKFCTEAFTALEEAKEKRSKLEQALARYSGRSRAFPVEGEALLLQSVKGQNSVGAALAVFVKRPVDEAARYWARVLCEAAFEPIDRKSLVDILHTKIKVAHSAARKALRLIDIQMHCGGAT
jgi:hypothetical protein